MSKKKKSKSSMDSNTHGTFWPQTRSERRKRLASDTFGTTKSERKRKRIIQEIDASAHVHSDGRITALLQDGKAFTFRNVQAYLTCHRVIENGGYFSRNRYNRRKPCKTLHPAKLPANEKRLLDIKKAKSGLLNVKWPRHITEADVVYELRVSLSREGLLVRGEVSVASFMRIDLVVYNDDYTPLVVIECKQRKINRDTWKNTIQGQRYSSLPIPCFLCGGMDDIARVTIAVLRLKTARMNKEVLPSPGKVPS